MRKPYLFRHTGVCNLIRGPQDVLVRDFLGCLFESMKLDPGAARDFGLPPGIWAGEVCIEIKFIPVERGPDGGDKKAEEIQPKEDAGAAKAASQPKVVSIDRGLY